MGAALFFNLYGMARKRPTKPGSSCAAVQIGQDLVESAPVAFLSATAKFFRSDWDFTGIHHNVSTLPSVGFRPSRHSFNR
jgi:hypothetical protein